MLPSPSGCRLGPRVYSFSRPQCVHCCYGPVTRTLPWEDLVDRLRRFCFHLLRYPNYGALTSTPAGLFPAEHASLHWTHNRPCPVSCSAAISPASRWPRCVADGSSSGLGTSAPMRHSPGWSSPRPQPCRSWSERCPGSCCAQSSASAAPGYSSRPKVGSMPRPRSRAVLTRLIERIDIGTDQIDIHFWPTRLAPLLDAATLLPSASDDEAQILSVPIRLGRTGREMTMRIDGTDPFATAKPDARLIKLLIRARRFNAALVGSDGVPFAALARREGISPSYFTRLVRLSYLAWDITQAILDGRQPPDLTADKLLAHSRLPLAWHEQRTLLGFT